MTVKKIKPLKNAHTSNSKLGMGDHYGSGIKQNTGRMIYDSINMTTSNSNTRKPPKSLA